MQKPGNSLSNVSTELLPRIKNIILKSTSHHQGMKWPVEEPLREVCGTHTPHRLTRQFPPKLSFQGHGNCIHSSALRKLKLTAYASSNLQIKMKVSTTNLLLALTQQPDHQASPYAPELAEIQASQSQTCWPCLRRSFLQKPL